MTHTLAPGQPGLWDLPAEPQPEPLPVKQRHIKPPTHTPRPRRSKEAQREECDPRCLVCGKPEGRGLCAPRCSVVCVHSRQPDLIEICLVTAHVTAILMTGTVTLRGAHRRALVSCPFCGDIHWHAATYGARYRVSGCGQPYIVHLARPRIAPWAAS